MEMHIVTPNVSFLGSKTTKRRNSCLTSVSKKPPKVVGAATATSRWPKEFAREMAKLFFGLGRPSAKSPNRVGPVQAEVLRIIRDRSGIAHGAGIAGYLRENFDADVSDAQTYIALRRLDVRGLIEPRPDTSDNRTTPSVGRRGRPHKLYSLTASGRRALEGGAADNSSTGTDAQMEGKFHGAKAKGPTPVVG
jgi:DNA-binding PadR family transcriptional regulator